jgi:thiopeptide-type bacteriocin biosynthesis protein
VLSPATWHVDAGMTAETFEAFRVRWRLPRRVYLAYSDNRLLLDLEDEDQLGQLHAEIGRLAGNGRLVLQEALPAPDDAWLPGPGGRYVTELVVPLVLAAVLPAQRGPIEAPMLVRPSVRAADGLRPPGSDWLFVKIYGEPRDQEELIAGPIRGFGTEACAAGLAGSWFFMRYADPEPHLRFRLSGDPDTLTGELAPELIRWAAALVGQGRCRRFSIDTYEQEVDRYGGPRGLAVAQDVFAVDSRAVADLLALDQGPLELDRLLLAARTVDELLATLGLTEADRLSWYRERVPDRRATAAEYRRRQADLRGLLGDPDWLPARAGGAEAARVLAHYRAGLAPAAERLRALGDRGELWHPVPQLARSFSHLHCNRLLAGGIADERTVYGLLVRARESLRHAPMRAAAESSG